MRLFSKLEDLIGNFLILWTDSAQARYGVTQIKWGVFFPANSEKYPPTFMFVNVSSKRQRRNTNK
jgi:hypothetical protein